MAGTGRDGEDVSHCFCYSGDGVAEHGACWDVKTGCEGIGARIWESGIKRCRKSKVLSSPEVLDCSMRFFANTDGPSSG